MFGYCRSPLSERYAFFTTWRNAPTISKTAIVVRKTVEVSRFGSTSQFHLLLPPGSHRLSALTSLWLCHRVGARLRFSTILSPTRPRLAFGTRPLFNFFQSCLNTRTRSGLPSEPEIPLDENFDEITSPVIVLKFWNLWYQWWWM